MGVGEDDFVIGYVGRLERVKGLDRLISAFAEISVEGSGNKVERKGGTESPQQPATNNYQLILVGDGSEHKALEKQAKELGVSDRVLFVGFQSDVSKDYAVMDLFVLPSRSEGLPVALLEAMVAGVPVAVTAVGECRDVVDGGGAGKLLPEKEDSWPAVISELLMVNSDEKEAMNERARKRVAEKYSLESTLDAYEKIYGRYLTEWTE